MENSRLKLSIEHALKEKENLDPKFRKQLEDKLKQLESKSYQDRMVMTKK